LKGLRLKILEECNLYDDEVYLDCENLLKVPGTKIVNGKVLNDNWDVLYKKVMISL
jgi:hypothetical protein